MHKYCIEPHLFKLLNKLAKKNKGAYETVMAKIAEIVSSYSIEHYKNLRYNIKESKRVHIGHFVLVFSYDKEKDMIIFEDFEHHDQIYFK
jgi:mRNA-degrading endonuclease RelE of RelBE toxin-antitoxin system